jgi:hypothetical protein
VSDDPESPQSDGASAGPFLGALAIIVAVVITIWLLNVFSGDDLTDDQLIGRAVAGQNDALQRLDYAAFRGFTCVAQQGKESEVLARQRDSADKRGARFVDKVGAVTVHGDRATAQVTFYFDKDAQAKQTTDIAMAREGGAWKVCSTGPR